MKSIKDVVHIISADSLLYPKEVLPPNRLDHYLQTIRLKRKVTFRVNRLKADKRAVTEQLRNLGIAVTEFSLIPNCFIVNNAEEKELLKLELVKSGEIYLQSISSQMPPFLLNPVPEEEILDMAAAPGSKTTQLCALMENRGHIDAVEPDFIRKERLEFNLRTQGCQIVSVHQMKGEVFAAELEDRYDKVLLDAPCSGEGRFYLYDKSSYSSYRPTEPPKFHRIQAKLLRSGLQALKSGGELLYSTCTLNTVENEEVLQEVLSDFDCRIAPLPDLFYQLPESLPLELRTVRVASLRQDIKYAIRILPSQRMEGFFLAKIRKR